jgi:hypothetical protein
MRREWAGFIWFKRETSGGLFEHGNELSVSIKRGEFFDQLRNIALLLDIRVFLHIHTYKNPNKLYRLLVFYLCD